MSISFGKVRLGLQIRTWIFTKLTALKFITAVAEMSWLKVKVFCLAEGCRKIQQNTDGQISVFSSHSDLRFCGSVVYLTLTAKDSCNQNVIWFRRDSDNTLRIESAYVFFPGRGRENKALFESCARRSGLANLVSSCKFCFMSSLLWLIRA